MLTKLKMFVFVVAMAAVLGATSVDAQRFGRIEVSATPEAANPSADLDQCANGKLATPEPCAGANWVNGNVNESKAHWEEDQFLSYRMKFGNLNVNQTYTIVIGYDVFKGSVHAIDYLGSYDFTESVGNNPCTGISGTHCTGVKADASFIPVPTETVPSLQTPGGAIPGDFRMWGGELLTIEYCDVNEPSTRCNAYVIGSEERMMKLTFKALVSNPVMAWGGHVAWQGDWGAGNSAGNISGSPYHMRLIGLDGDGGQQDRSLSATAVAIPAILRIKKNAANDPRVPLPPGTSFGFAADAAFGPTSFNLLHLGTQNSDAIGEAFFGVAIGVDEILQPNDSWSLESVACVNTVGGAAFANFTFDPLGDSIEVTLAEANDVTCTFNNVQSFPSAAPAFVAGRVTDAYGRGISAARVQVFNAITGASVAVNTNTFGYYKINDLSVGDFYVMNVSHRRYAFVSGSNSFTLNSDLTGMDFQASH